MSRLEPYSQQHQAGPPAPLPGPEFYGELAAPQQGAPDIKGTLAGLWKHRYLMLLIFGSCVFLGAFVSVNQAPLYRASSRIIVDTGGASGSSRPATTGYDPVSEMLEAGRSRSMATEIQVIQSAPLIAEAVKLLALKPRDIPEYKVSASNAEGTDVVDVSVTAPAPRFAANLANAVTSTYIARSEESNRASVRAAKRFVQDQLATKKAQLDAAEARLRRFKEATGISSVSEEVSSTLGRLGQYQGEITAAQVDLRSLDAQLRSVNALLSATEKTIVAESNVIANPLISTLYAQISNLEQERAMKLKEYQPDTPEVKELEDRIGVARAALQREMRQGVISAGKNIAPNPARLALVQQAADLRSQRIAAQARLAALRPVLAGQQQALKALPAKERDFASMQRQVAGLDQMYTALMSQLQEISLREQAQLASARLLEPAEPPEVPINTPMARSLMASAVLGMMLAAGVAFLLETLADSVRGPEDSERRFGLPTLGAIPAVSRVRGAIVTGPGDRSMVAESYRLLRGHLRFASPDRPVRSLVVTSPGQGEGKSTTALNLAIALASSGSRVILVDADLRAPSLGTMLGVKGKQGLSSVVLEGVPLEEALQETPIENLRLLLPGSLPPNPPEFLDSQRCRAVLGRLPDLADFVVYDSPPASLLTDALVLSTQTDGVLLVARWNKTRRQALRHVVDRFMTARGYLLGLCVNGMQPSGTAFGYHYYYHHYRSYGGGRLHEPSTAATVPSGPQGMLEIPAGDSGPSLVQDSEAPDREGNGSGV